MTPGHRDDAARVGSPSVGRHRSSLILALAVAVIMLCWMIAVPRGAGPDEQAHVTRGAALVRGQLRGDSDWPLSSYAYLRVPWWVLQPNPACYAFKPLQPANCAAVIEPEDAGAVRVLNQAVTYPPTAHVLAGLATLLPGKARTQWLARVVNGLVPGLLIVWTMAVLRRLRSQWLLRVGALVALTPGVWFFGSVVNPSGWVAAGALAMWTALLSARIPADKDGVTVDERVWLFVAGWCAMSLSRFDGLAFAVLVAALGLLWGSVDLLAGLRARRPALVLVTLAALTNAGWAVFNGRRQYLFGGRPVEVAILALIVIGSVLLGRRPEPGRRPRSSSVPERWVWLTPVLVVAAPVAAFFIISAHRRAAYAAAVGNTGNSLEEAVGVLGWVDTRIPAFAFALWFVAAGALLGVAVLRGDRRAVVVVLSAAASIPALQWFLQGEIDYWHGRYLFGVFVGVPMLAAAAAQGRGGSDRTWNLRRFGAVVGALVWVVWVLAFAQTMRRFGVGEVGVMNPARWDTYGALLPPPILLVVFSGASAVLLAHLLAPPPAEERTGG